MEFLYNTDFIRIASYVSLAIMVISAIGFIWAVWPNEKSYTDECQEEVEEE